MINVDDRRRFVDVVRVDGVPSPADFVGRGARTGEQRDQGRRACELRDGTTWDMVEGHFDRRASISPDLTPKTVKLE